MKCKYCHQEMVIESRHQNIITFKCKNPECPYYKYTHTPYKHSEDTGERAAPYDNAKSWKQIYNNEERHYHETLINHENQKEE